MQGTSVQDYLALLSKGGDPEMVELALRVLTNYAADSTPYNLSFSFFFFWFFFGQIYFIFSSSFFSSVFFRLSLHKEWNCFTLTPRAFSPRPTQNRNSKTGWNRHPGLHGGPTT